MPLAQIPHACVIGHPIAHSRSPLLHGYWLQQLGLPGAYNRRDVAPEALAAFFAGMANDGLVGCNVTVPHKRAVLPFLSRLDDAAAAVGAVNTIWREGGGWVGGNSDVPGFLDNLDEAAPGWDAAAGQAVLIGAGGAARAIVYALRRRGFGVAIVNRSPAAAEALAADFAPGTQGHGLAALASLLPQADLLVNASSLGMQGKAPFNLPIAGLKASAIVCDIVYAPLETGLLRLAGAAGHRTVDGLGMLLHQGKLGFERWFGGAPQVTGDLRALIAADILSEAR